MAMEEKHTTMALPKTAVGMMAPGTDLAEGPWPSRGRLPSRSAADRCRTPAGADILGECGKEGAEETTENLGQPQPGSPA